MTLIFKGNWTWDEVTIREMVNEKNLPSEWNDFFYRKDIVDILYKISDKLEIESKTKTIYPSPNHIFKAFYTTPPHKIKAIIQAMDPYFNGAAEGICFSVQYGCAINPSLRNIYKELEVEGFSLKKDGDLSPWTRDVLMINTALTVEKGKAGSHLKLWNEFTLELIKWISCNVKDIVWIQFGAKARIFDKFLPSSHKKVTCSHPSPLSAYTSSESIPAFIGSGIFNQANNELKSMNKEIINWDL